VFIPNGIGALMGFGSLRQLLGGVFGFLTPLEIPFPQVGWYSIHINNLVNLFNHFSKWDK